MLHRNRMWIMGAFIIIVTFFFLIESSGTNMLKGQVAPLTPPPSTQERVAVAKCIDTDSDDTRTIREFRLFLRRLISSITLALGGQTLNSLSCVDINGDRNITQDDLLRGVSTMQFLRLCGNGVINGAEECDDGNTNAYDGCSPICTVTGVCAFLNEHQQVVERRNMTKPQCEAEKTSWCTTHPDSVLIYNQSDPPSYGAFYCEGPARSCNIISSRDGTSVGGYFGTATSPLLCLASHVRNCDSAHGKPVEFNGVPISICKNQATEYECTDTDVANYVTVPGIIDSTYVTQYPTRVPRTTPDTCVVSGGSGAQGPTNKCVGFYCFTRQNSCSPNSPVIPNYPSFSVQDNGLLKCEYGCFNGHCNLFSGSSSFPDIRRINDVIYSRFTCTLAGIATTGTIMNRLDFAETLSRGPITDATTQCIGYAALRYGARTTLLQSLLSRAVPRETIDLIAVHQLFQSEWKVNRIDTSTSGGSGILWNPQDAINFLTESNTQFTRKMLELYNSEQSTVGSGF